MIKDAIKRLMARRTPASLEITPEASRVLAIAESHGYRVIKGARQGRPVVVIEKDGTGIIHMWSSDDIVDLGRSKNWIKAG
jgi:hypothetical protein